jgi:taurine dioxygenase
MPIQIAPAKAPLGAEITGLDLSISIAADDLQAVKQTLAKHGVIVFRDQSRLAPGQHVAFSRHFGPLQIHIQHHYHHPEHPEILTISNIQESGKPIGLSDAGRYWHSDLSYVAEPSLGSLLHAIELPEEGGDTLFANMVAAYAALPPGLQARIDHLQAEHSYEARNKAQQEAVGALRPGLSEAQKSQVPPVVHPVVRLHPETGQKALFVNEGFTTRIIGVPEEDSRSILNELFRFSTEERFIYRHKWRPFDLLFWDNRQTMHLATPFPPHYRRRLYRTTVKGTAPVGPAVVG